MPNRRRGVLAALTISALVGSVALATPAAADSTDASIRKMTRAVTLAGVLQHEVALQAIGSLNEGNRASGGPGYDASAAYVALRLRLAGYQVTRQQFDFPYFEEISSAFSQLTPAPTDYVNGETYSVADFSGSGEVTGAVVPVDLALTPPRASTSGCEAADFAGLDVAGNIALMQRGGCAFGVKVANAAAAGAIGAILFNQGDGTAPDRFNLLAATLGTPQTIPTVGLDFATGEQFATTPGLTVRIAVDAISEIRTTTNVIAQTRTGRTDRVVMAGAHLDSEPDTVGINDNASGSSVLLETALQLAKQKIKPRNAVRFAWWGAEESNLQGSTYYVANLPDEQLAQIQLYLNFDMVASPNYILGVYDGDDSDGVGSGPGPAGSAAIENVFTSFFAARGTGSVGSDFTGRSDYGPFIAAGVDIPAGGLFTGAEGIKTDAQAAQFGGIAGLAYDPCYHDACDSLTPERDGAPAGVHAQLRASGYRLLGNLNLGALDVNADAVATAVTRFALDLTGIPVRPAPATTTARTTRATAAVTDGAAAA